MLVLSGNYLHCINLNVGGERSSGAKCCLSEQKSMMALMLESTPIELWSKSFTARPFLTCPLEKLTCMCVMHKNGIFNIFHNGLLKCRFVPYDKVHDCETHYIMYNVNMWLKQHPMNRFERRWWLYLKACAFLLWMGASSIWTTKHRYLNAWQNHITGSLFPEQLINKLIHVR